MDVVKLLLDTGKVDVDAKDQDGRTPLAWATENGHKVTVKLLLEHKADVTVANSNGWTPLHTAASEGHLEVIKLLLENGADVSVANKDGWTPVHAAASKAHVGVVKLLLDTGKVDVHAKDQGGWTPLAWAADNGHWAVVKLLLDTGKVDVDAKDQDGRTPLAWAAENGHGAVVQLLFNTGKVDVDAKDQDGQTPLAWAVKNGHKVTVKLLLEHKADVTVANSNGWTPLHSAASEGHLEVVKLLLDKDADLTIQNNNGDTPLYTAALNGRLEVVKLLFDNVDVTVPDNKGRYYSSAFYAAAYGGHEQIISLLLDKGADVNTHSGEYGIVLHAAILTCSIPIVRLLLDQGADPAVRDKHGWTASMIAFQTGNRELCDILGAYGYDPQSSCDQCLVPTILTAPGTSTVKITADGTVANSGQLNSKELQSKVQIRSDHPFPSAKHSVYFEITFHSIGINGEIGVGFCHEDSPRTGMPGWKKGSWGYHGDDGNLYLEKGQGVQFGDTYGVDDVIGCGSDIERDEFFFTKNGTRVGSAGKSLQGRLFAVVGVGCESFNFSVNFGPAGFMYSL